VRVIHGRKLPLPSPIELRRPGHDLLTLAEAGYADEAVPGSRGISSGSEGDDRIPGKRSTVDASAA